MLNFIRKPFGYEPIVTKEDLKKDYKKKVDKASNWKSVLSRIWKLVDEQRFLLVVVLLLVVASSALALLGPYMIGVIIDEYISKGIFTGLANMIGLLIIVYVFSICHDVFAKLLDDWNFPTNDLQATNRIIHSSSKITCIIF